MALVRLTPADYVTTQWSGGSTTQLVIAPEGAVYADRDFLWRVSSATVELEESDFTALPDYWRCISTVRGDMTLTHNGGAPLTLHPGEVHEFDGGDDTHSVGRCTDFNLMLRKDRAAGHMGSLFLSPGRTRYSAGDETEELLLFCAEGSCAVTAKDETVRLSAGEAALLRGAAKAELDLSCEDSAFLMTARMRRL